MINKTLGSALIVSGTAIGGGMLALPLFSHRVGLPTALCVMLFTCALMYYCALMICECTLAFKPRENHFSSMTLALLGKPGQIIIWLSCFCLLYSLTAAYISGATSIFNTVLAHFFNVSPPPWLTSLLFTLVFGGIVVSSTQHIDLFNRGLMSIKMVILIVALACMMPKVSPSYLVEHRGNVNQILLIMPYFLTSFAFHHVIPGLATYLEQSPKALVRALQFGTVIPLVVYTFWLTAILGIIPEAGAYSFSAMDRGEQTALGDMIQLLSHHAHSQWLTVFIDAFFDIALITSFLGVTLGLFDFMADALKRQNDLKGRLQTGAITFIPPLIFSLIYPNGFLMALGYAAIFVAIMQIIIPALMVHRLRNSDHLSSPYRAPGNTPVLIVVGVIGVAFIVVGL